MTDKTNEEQQKTSFDAVKYVTKFNETQEKLNEAIAKKSKEIHKPTRGRKIIGGIKAVGKVSKTLLRKLLGANDERQLQPKQQNGHLKG